MADTLQLNVGGYQGRYKVDPLVIFSILDHHKRRQQEQTRVIGALLGEKINNQDYLVKNAFPVMITETKDQITMDTEYITAMLDLHKRVNAREVLVGWYATGDEITYTSALIHDAFKKYTSNPFHLNVDTDLKDSKLSIRGYLGHDVALGDKNLIIRFEETPTELHAYEAEKIVVDALLNGAADENDMKLDAPARILTDFENLELSLANLIASVDTISNYVDQVVSGEIEGDDNLGRAISEALSSIPRLDAESVEKMIHGNIQDMLMLIYLANLTRTQIALANKIQTAL